MQLIRLIYSSKASAGIGYEDLLRIRTTAVAHNREQHICGVLCFGAGVFLQALEGERGEVNRLYNRIVTDPRHSDPQVMSAEPISALSFLDWSMKLVSWDEAYTPHRRELMLKLLGMTAFDPAEMTGPQAYHFLRELSVHERRITSSNPVVA
ncbi:MAG: BLUF domain-containing protein [Gemmatimonadaceae bacterium]|nr:BLUF domain-containing protein [Gemmatimonadaceae bacterium]